MCRQVELKDSEIRKNKKLGYFVVKVIGLGMYHNFEIFFWKPLLGGPCKHFERAQSLAATELAPTMVTFYFTNPKLIREQPFLLNI